MTQWKEHLWHKHEDPSSNPQHKHKKPVVATPTYKVRAVGTEPELLRLLPAILASGSMRELSQENKVENNASEHLASVHRCVYMYFHKHLCHTYTTHTHTN